MISIQYYIFTKNPLPMDIEFLVHDIYTGTRPQWKLASNLEEASKAFQLVLAQDRKAAGLDGPELQEPDDDSSGSSTEDEMADVDDDDDAEVDEDEVAASDDEDEEEDDEVGLATAISSNTTTDQEPGKQDDDRQTTSEESVDEAIIVTRQEEEIDPEEDADFEREYAKMMSDSLESRKLDRRPVFDVALPVRSRPREATNSIDQGDGESEAPAPKMAFSVLTKKGNKQQVSLSVICKETRANCDQTRTLELPTDSHFAVAMRSQQQAEREEQQRIKNLVLNYDLRDNDGEEGETRPSCRKCLATTRSNQFSPPGSDSRPITHHHNHRYDKANNKNPGQRVKKLQFEDFEWYENSAHVEQLDSIPRRVHGRRPIERLSKSDLGPVNEDAETHDTMDDFVVAIPHSRPSRCHWHKQTYRTR